MQAEEYRGAAIEGASNEDQIEQRDVVEGEKQGEEGELKEGLLVLISITRHDGYEEICLLFMILR